jgi:hypothetical protein
MPARIERDTTLIVLLSKGTRKIERALAPGRDAAAGLAIMMLAKRGDDLHAGDVLRVLAPG